MREHCQDSRNFLPSVSPQWTGRDVSKVCNSIDPLATIIPLTRISRLHVVANHRRAVLFTLAAVVLAQLTIGLITTLSPCTPAAPKASMDTSTFQPCFFVMSGSMGYAYIGLSLLFGEWFFVGISPRVRPFNVITDVSIFLGVAMAVYGPGRSFLVTSYLLRQVIQETSIYFGVMVCSHLAMALAQVLSQVRLSLSSALWF